MNEKEKIKGLSKSNQTFILTVFFIALLIFGPIEPYGLIIRIAYLIVLPALLYFLLKYIGNTYELDDGMNDRIGRSLASMIAGGFFVAAFITLTQKSHMECDELLKVGRDEAECVGDYVRVSGPDYFQGIVFIAIGAVAVWYSLVRRNDQLRND